MSPVKDVGGVSQGLPAKSLGRKLETKADVAKVRSSREGKTEKVQVSSVSKSSGDKVDISVAGRRLLDQKAEVSRHVRQLRLLSTMDQDSLEGIREKVESGVYSRPEVMDRIAEALLGLPGFERASSGSSKVPRPRELLERLEKVRKKIENGEYESEEALRVVVERLLEDLRSTSTT